VLVVPQLAEGSLVHIADVERGLRREEVHLAHDPCGLRVIRDPVGPGGLAFVEVLRQRVADLGRELLDHAVRLEHLSGAFAALGHRLQVPQAQLGRDGVDVRDGIDAVLDVNDVGVVEASRDLHDRVDLADVGQKLVAQALALVSTPHEPRDVDEVYRRREDPVRVDDGVQRLEARVGHLDDAHVRLDRAERVVRRFCLRRRERVEERRLTDVREANDTD
jgi:hypothetical protein